MDKILVTRPSQDYARTEAALVARGFEALSAPMMEFTAKMFKAPKLRGLDGLIFTSANGVRAVQNSQRYKQLACYVVGQQSHKAAVEQGFEVLATGDGDVESLSKIIAQDYSERGLTKPLLHISGVHKAGNLSHILAKKQIEIQSLQAYEMQEIEQISANVTTAIETHKIKALLFYSARSAEIFIKNMQKIGFLEKIYDVPAFCLSKNIADRVCKPYLKQIYFVKKPDEMALLDLVENKLS